MSTPTSSSRHLRVLLAATLVVPCCGLVGPDYERPVLLAPDRWYHAALAGLSEGEANLQTWWTVFGDPVLDGLVDRAVAGNPDLEIAMARIEEARGLRQIAAADRYPTVGVGGDAKQRWLDQDILLESDESLRTYSAGADLSWEIDVWGRVSRNVAAAEAGVQASVEDYRDVLVLLLAELATNYVDLRTLQQRIRFTQANIATQRETLDLTSELYGAQLASEIDLRQAELNLARTESFLPALRIQLYRAVHRIAVLLGEQPHAMYGLLEEVREIPSPPDDVAAGIPADVIRNRPDLRAAERRLAAQVEKIGVATAELYPTFALDATFGWDKITGSDLFAGAAQLWSIGIPFSWTAINRGRQTGNLRIEEAAADALQAQYEKVFLRALEEVENSLVGYGEQKRRVEFLGASVAAAQRSVELVLRAYRSGLTDFQNVLILERSLLVEQDELVNTRGRVLTNLIRLYRSLGGGWSPNTPVPEDDPAS